MECVEMSVEAAGALLSKIKEDALVGDADFTDINFEGKV